MKIQFLSGSKCVGKSAILVSEEANLMLDYGVRLHPEPPEYPPLPQVDELDAVIPSHCHLDHCGAIPILYKVFRPILYTNGVSFELINLLIRDSAKITRLKHFPQKFSKRDIGRMRRHYQLINYRHPFKVGDLRVTAYSAGHVPGSAMILVEGKKKVLYTGDVNLKDTELLKGCDLPNVRPDVLIIESTYAERDHPDRLNQEKRFIGKIQETLANNGSVVIPVFAVGRAQEILLLLEKYGIEDKIALDGMAKKASEIILSYKRYLRDPQRLKRILNKVEWVKNQRQRESLLRRPRIILATAGMMGGGPVVYYMSELHDREDCRVLLVGYQVEDTPGRTLMDTKHYEINGEVFKVRIGVEKFDFSSHAGGKDLVEIVRRLKPKKVFCVHGDDTPRFAKTLRARGFDASSPEEGEVFEI